MRLQLKRFLTLFLVLALATVALAACGGDDEEDAGLGEDSEFVEDPLVDDDPGLMDDDAEILEEDDDTTVTGVDDTAYDFERYDTNTDQVIDPEEFTLFLEDTAISDVEAFAVYDDDDNGLLDEDEFDDFLLDEGLTGGD